jgi:cation diffusion facilitator CzcD-associated flavoprotein CzcO
MSAMTERPVSVVGAGPFGLAVCKELGEFEID